MRGSTWESGFDIGSVGGGLIAGTSYTQVDASCFLLNLDGEVVSSPADPSVPGCEDPDCPRYCTLSPDARRLAHLETRFDQSTNTALAYEIVVDDMTTGDELARIEIPHPEDSVSGLDVLGDWLIVNRVVGEQGRAWIIDLAGTTVPTAVMPVPGVARFVTPPVTVRPAPLVLRGDGLGIVALGQPMASVMPLLEARFGAPSDEWTYEADPACDGSGYAGTHCCFAATGYPCDTYYRGVVWDEAALSVIFADGGLYRDDGIPHLTYWSTWRLTGPGLATEEGIAVGDPVGDVRAAYGNQLVRTSVGCGDDVPTYRTEGEESMMFELSGPPDDPTTTVTSVWAGNPGSC